MMLAWRNAPEVRRNMYTKHEITAAEHQSWFARLKDDVTARWFIHEDATGQPNGVVYFTQLQSSNRGAFWGFYAAPNAMPGTGTRMEFDALEKVFLELSLRKLNCEVLVTNGQVINLHKKFGFKEEGTFRDFHFDGQSYVDVVRLGILATEWVGKRVEIQARIAKLDVSVKPVSTTERHSVVAQKSYIVASCKFWNESAFDLLKSKIEADWHWVTTQDQLFQALHTCTPRYIFFLHWNWFVADEIWQKHECVCFHMTDVPYGRGGSPLQNLIVAGHKETKLTALRMVADMDAGPVYTKRPLSLDGRAESIYKRAGELSFDVIRWMLVNEPTPVAQQGEVVSFKRRKPAQSSLPAEGELETVYDHIRMLDAPSYPLAFIEHGEMRLEFSNAVFEGDDVTADVKISKIKPQSTEVN
jgi:UDP-4-amino-4,6-dideoxy-N-acetyl-beta-L-altrosamine N-acetyltransferase